MARLNDRIVPLDELDDFKVADGDPDVRGWKVIGSDGQTVGEVDDLLIDTAAMKVRYLDVDLDASIGDHDAGTERHILIPIGYARLDENDDQIFVDQLPSTRLSAFPAFTPGVLNPDYEASLRQHLDTDYSAGAAETDFYANDLYDQDRFYGARRGTEGEQRMTLSEEELTVGTRERNAGAVEVDKTVETRHVRESVPVAHEEVVVERRPATPGMSAEARIEEGEIRVPISEEELVVQKRTVPREELVVKKREVVENESVEADLRRERADIRREGDVDVREER